MKKVYNKIEAIAEYVNSDDFQLKFFGRMFKYMGIVCLACGIANPWLILIGCMCLLLVIACKSEMKK